MKKRRTTVLAFLLVAAIFLGIGYANVTDNLYIFGFGSSKTKGGNDSVEEVFKTNIRFTAVASSSNATIALKNLKGQYVNVSSRLGNETDNLAKPVITALGMTPDTGDAGNADIAVIEVTGFVAAGDKVTVPCEITNTNTDIDAVLSARLAEETDTEHFKVTFAWQTNTGDENVTEEGNQYKGQPIIKADGGKRMLDVTIEMIKTPTDTTTTAGSEIKTTFNIVIDAVAHKQ